ncbi:hypothetical protein GCK72_004912 [Caenorhabditis remanei]|uniref:Uncharacterized protein n=1 Tax=Caenorhabditis remanei TaxID=31234 RepID=A0A6A5HDG4_CAERE|nr:hypothetical protein GCK72_004912 [Caenorhabditis remanei]KAF1764961.1 hypothetical protein GCK72_004912 [Caenorhabditis remanei]
MIALDINQIYFQVTDQSNVDLLQLNDRSKPKTCFNRMTEFVNLIASLILICGYGQYLINEVNQGEKDIRMSEEKVYSALLYLLLYQVLSKSLAAMFSMKISASAFHPKNQLRDIQQKQREEHLRNYPPVENRDEVIDQRVDIEMNPMNNGTLV